MLMLITVLIFVLIFLLIILLLIFIWLLILIVKIQPVPCMIHNNHTTLILQRLTVLHSQILVIPTLLRLQSIQVLILLFLTYLLLALWWWNCQLYWLIQILILSLTSISKHSFLLLIFMWLNKQIINAKSPHILGSMSHIVA